MMNSQPTAQQQASFQNQMHQQAQNPGQQRPAPNGIQKPMQGQQQQQGSNPNANYDPQLALWALEKTKSDETWADVDPERLHMSLQDLQSELTKFQRKKGSPITAFEEITSANCRKTISQLVEDQTAELQRYNKTLKYTIAGVLTDWRTIRHGRQLKRVRVILSTQPSGLMDPQTMKSAAGGAMNAQDLNKMKQAGQGQGQLNGQGPNMGQQQQQRGIPPQGQNMGHNPPFDQRPPPPPPQGGQGQMHSNANGPPPPPPNHGGGHSGQGPPPPPPPPPGGIPPPGSNFPHANAMPGTFPGSTPMHGIRPGQPPVQIIDPFMHRQRPKRNVRLDTSASDSSTGWESESVSEGSGPTHLGNVEHGEYGYVGRRGERARSRHSLHGKKKSKHHRSRSGVRSRSRSVAPHHRSSKQRRDSDHFDSFARGRYSPRSGRASPASGRNSPTSSTPSSPKLPSVHIHMDGGKSSSGDEHGYSHGKRRNRRDRSIEASPARHHSRRTHDKTPGSRRMSRGSSQESWISSDRSSGAASSSGRTAEDGNFDRTRRHGRTQSYSRQHGAYDDFDRRHHIRDSRADDYPGYSTSPREQYHKDPVFGSRPAPLRRQTMPNPFASDLPHRRPVQQSYSYATEADRYPLPHQSRYATATSPVEDRFKMEELADVIMERMGEPRRGSLRRSHTDRRDSGMVEDEWERYPPSRGRTYAGDRYR